MRTLIVVPTYNERDNLHELVAKVFEHAGDAHLLIVDDNSPDGTGKFADSLASAADYAGRVFVLHRDRKAGLGPAYIAGFAYALARDYEQILQMDGDLSHDPTYIPVLRERCGTGCDLVLGSRYLNNGISVVNWDMKRLMLSRAACRYAQFVLRFPFTDPTGGFKCWRRATLESIGLDSVFSNGYLFQIEMTYKAFSKGFRIEETPIIFFERKLGRSKMNWRIIREAMFGVVRLRMRQ